MNISISVYMYIVDIHNIEVYSYTKILINVNKFIFIPRQIN